MTIFKKYRIFIYLGIYLLLTVAKGSPALAIDITYSVYEKGIKEGHYNINLEIVLKQFKSQSKIYVVNNTRELAVEFFDLQYLGQDKDKDITKELALSTTNLARQSDFISHVRYAVLEDDYDEEKYKHVLYFTIKEGVTIELIAKNVFEQDSIEQDTIEQDSSPLAAEGEKAGSKPAGSKQELIIIDIALAGEEIDNIIAENNKLQDLDLLMTVLLEDEQYAQVIANQQGYDTAELQTLMIVLQQEYDNQIVLEKQKAPVLAQKSSQEKSKQSPSKKPQTNTGKAPNREVLTASKPKTENKERNTATNNMYASTKKTLGKPVIVIDAGHGGKDPGATGTTYGTKEKDINLRFAKHLEAYLRSTGRYEVYMTRDKDIYIDPYKRLAIARTKQADMFISIHSDSAGKKSSARGMTVFTMSDDYSNQIAEALLAKNTYKDGVSGISGIAIDSIESDVARTIISLSQTKARNNSELFAKMLINNIGKYDKAVVRKNAHQYKGFAVLRSADTPSILIELGFLTNPIDERLLRDKTYQLEVSKRIALAVGQYFNNIGR